MSLSDNYKPVKYIGNGVTKDFSFNFNMIDKAYCRVFLQDIETGEQTTKTIETDYTLDFGDDGGTVSMKVAPTTEQYIVVYRDVSLDQKSDFRVGDTFSAVKIEEEFDKQMAAIQQMKDGLNRSPKVPEGYNVNLTLPKPNAGKALVWNETENGFKNSTVDVDNLEEVTKQYRDEAQAARDAAKQSETNAKASEDNAKAQAERTQGIADAFDANAEQKTQKYNTNAQQKLDAYNSNDAEKTQKYNTNAQQKLDAYNSNDAEKTQTFNQNAAEKQDKVDERANDAALSAQESAESAEQAKQYAIKASFGNIGDIKYTSRTDVPNGGAWCDGAEYTQAMFPDIYQMLVDGKISSTDYSTFDSSVSTNGSCGFFGLDTSNERFKVPLLKDVYIKAGQAPLMFGAESLPNITGGTGFYSTGKEFGSFYATDYNSRELQSAGDNARGVGFAASKSSPAYQDGAKVNPNHVVYRAYVVLYASAAEASVAQAQEFMTALGNKANTDLSNITNESKNNIAELSAVDYSSGVSYSLPSPGNVFSFDYSGLLVMYPSNVTGDIVLRLNDASGMFVHSLHAQANIELPTNHFPVTKGQKYYVELNNVSTTCVIYPLKGTNNA